MEIWSSFRIAKNKICRVINGRMVKPLTTKKIKNRRIIEKNSRWREKHLRKEEAAPRNKKWKEKISNRIIFKIISWNSGLKTQWAARGE